MVYPDRPSSNKYQLSSEFLSIYESLPIAENYNAQHECTICIEKLNKDGEIKILPCKHIFHGICIKKWFEEKINCPICRRIIKIHKRRRISRVLSFIVIVLNL